MGHICGSAIVDVLPIADSQSVVNREVESSDGNIDVLWNKAAAILDVCILEGAMNVHKHFLASLCRTEDSYDGDFWSVFCMISSRISRDRRVELIWDSLIAVDAVQSYAKSVHEVTEGRLEGFYIRLASSS